MYIACAQVNQTGRLEYLLTANKEVTVIHLAGRLQGHIQAFPVNKVRTWQLSADRAVI